MLFFRELAATGAEVDVFLGSGERPDICNPIGGHKPISGGDRFPLTSERVVRRAGVLLRGPAQKSTARPASPPEVGLGGWAMIVVRLDPSIVWTPSRHYQHVCLRPLRHFRKQKKITSDGPPPHNSKSMHALLSGSQTSKMNF